VGVEEKGAGKCCPVAIHDIYVVDARDVQGEDVEIGESTFNISDNVVRARGLASISRYDRPIRASQDDGERGPGVEAGTGQGHCGSRVIGYLVCSNRRTAAGLNARRG
jgi:hypothetical protein